jgi:hypothetical protein
MYGIQNHNNFGYRIALPKTKFKLYNQPTLPGILS